MTGNIKDESNLGNFGTQFVNSSQEFATKALSGAVESFTRDTQNALDSTIRNVVRGNMSPRDAIRGGVDSLLGGAFTDAFGGVEAIGGGVWQSSKYAGDFIENWAPKNKFLFKVRFVFNTPFDSGMGSEAMEFYYAVKAVDKPKVSYEYDEVNMYNFRTKVLRTMRYDALNITFHDDISNKVLNFFDYYRRCMSPLADFMAHAEGGSPLMEGGGMNFADFKKGGPRTGQPYTASTGHLPNNQYNILKQIELIQIFAHGADFNKFVFVNPKITNFDFDDLDHDVSDGNQMTASFEYDGLYVSYANGREGNFSGLPQTYHGDNMQGRSPKSLAHRPGGGVFGQEKSYLMMPGAIAGGLGGGGFITGIGKSLLAGGASYLGARAAQSISKKIMGSSLGGKLQNTAAVVSGGLGGIANQVVGAGANALAGGLFNRRGGG
jgi:hypothetical protein